MRFLKVAGIYFYSAILILMGLIIITVAILFSLQNNPIQTQDITDFFYYFQTSLSARIAAIFSGAILILISSWFADIILGRFHQEKTIAFPTDSGEVTIALSAVEDLIKRLTSYLPEIKELRPDVIAGKKGIVVDLRVTLKSEANIPELTERLQKITRSKIQEVLGIEDEIIIKIHILKIVNPEEKERKRKDFDKADTAAVPFSGFNRV